MKKDIRTQYDSLAKDFSLYQEDKNYVSRREFRKITKEDDISGKKVLDLACGDGIDAQYYYEQGADVVGLDASEELIEIAKEKYPNVSFMQGFAEKLPFENNSFDFIYTKYAIMTSADMKPIFNEVFRILKKGGTFVYLVVHPMRHFFERKTKDANYFEKTIVNSHVFDGAVTFKEPTHTFNEYFNTDFFNRFEMIDFIESWDPAAEQINNAKTPGFFIVKSKKK